MRRYSFKHSSILGAAAAALILFMTIGTLGAVIYRADGLTGISAQDWHVIRFTLTQAFLSALCSILFAIPLARALARRAFFGRSLLISLLGAPFILPVIVAVLGIIGVFGNNGIIAKSLNIPTSIFGFHGIIVAHVFFNLPLATRLILQGWQAIPSESFRLAASLNADCRKVLERPMLRAVLPNAFLVIFLICLSSFAIALTLGGGPKSTTIELSIYQAFRFDFDLSKASLLGIIQVIICAMTVLVLLKITKPQEPTTGLDRPVEMWEKPHPVLDVLWIVSAFIFLAAPIAVIISDGIPQILNLHSSLWPAAIRSIWIALLSAFMSLFLSLCLATWIVSLKTKGKWIEFIGALPLATSQLVIGTGLFIIIFPFIAPYELALPITATVNAIATIPFCLRSLVPAIRDAEETFGKLSDQLGLSGYARYKILIAPRIKRPMGFCIGLSTALSMGDLGVIALFAQPGGGTLPMAVYSLMSAYKMEEAASGALLLILLSFVLFWIFDQWGRKNAHS